MSRCGILFACAVLVVVATVQGELRTWVDAGGKNRVDAELVSVESGVALLRKTNGSTVKVPIDKLSTEDKKYLEVINGSTTATGKSATTTYSELERLGNAQRDASFVLKLHEGFLKTPGAKEEELEKARQALPELQKLASRDSIRVGNKWMTRDEYRQAKESEIRLIKEAHRLIDVKNDELAKDKFIEASKSNPEAVRADFYLGLLNALVAHHAPEAHDHFSECVRRMARDEDLLVGARRANFVAALNNLAIVTVRKRQYGEAISYWKRALEIAPFTPELVQNLGLMSELAQTANYVRIGKEQRNAAGNLYAKATVDNNLARFDEKVGWLFIPFVDTLDGSMDSTGDEEMVNVGWCTGFSVGGEYLITSRYPLEDADGISVRAGGNVFEVQTGKVVALSEDSHLVIVRIPGLTAKPLSLNLTRPRAAEDVTIAGFGNPGLTADTIQQRQGTILDPPKFFGNVEVVVRQQVKPGVDVFVRSRGVRQLLMHDAITNAGMEGAPLLDKKGHVVGIHLGNRAEFGRFGSKNSWAESGDYIRDKISSVVSNNVDQSNIAQSESTLDETALKNLVDSSVFQLAVQKRAPRLAWSHRIEELHRLQKQGGWTSFEDKTCMACNGRLQLECPNRNCTRGVVRHKERELKQRDPNTGVEQYGYRTVAEKCSVCSGKGFVTCPNCSGRGVDNSLK